MIRKTSRNQQGFTLIELMIVVVILGVLASVSVSSYRRFILQSKVSEAPLNLKQIVNGQILYYAETHLDHLQQVKPKGFRAFPATPTQEPCYNNVPRYAIHSTIWQDNGWNDIQFGIYQSHYFQYQVDASGIGTGATFTAIARADLDCDKTLSTFKVHGEISAEGQPSIIGMTITNELE